MLRERTYVPLQDRRTDLPWTGTDAGEIMRNSVDRVVGVAKKRRPARVEPDVVNRIEPGKDQSSQNQMK